MFMKKRKVTYFIFVIMLLFFGIMTVNAASTGSMYFSGNENVSNNSDFSIDIYVGSISGTGRLMGVGGEITISDTSCVELDDIVPTDPSSLANKPMFSYLSMNGTDTETKIQQVKLKAKSNCETYVNIKDPTISFTDGTNLTPSTISKKIVVGGSSSTPSASDDATLKSLSPNTGDLSPAFASGTLSYSMTVENETGTISFTAVPNDSKATVKSGTTCSLSVGSNSCKIVVEAEDGTKKTYTVNVTRKGSEDEPGEDEPGTDDPGEDEPKPASDASLKSLDISGFTLSPAFNKNTTSYSITVPNNITGLDVEAIPVNENATVKIIGNSEWSEGVNPVKVIVTAEDGTKKIYTINVTRTAASSSSNPGGTKAIDDPQKSNNYLKSLTIYNGELKPDFNKNTSNYTITIGNQETKVDLSAIAEVESSSVTIVGNDNLVVGVNTVTIEVTAKDGSLRVYTLNVTRSDKSSNTKLKDIEIKDHKLEPSFSPDKYEYNVKVSGNVSKLDLSAFAQNPNAKVEITGNDDLKEGNNVILIKVTDENGFTQYYRVNVEKEAADKKFLGLTFRGWLILLGILLGLGLLLFILLLLLGRKKDKKEKVTITESQAPVIEFKPEFNFGSKNGTDDDIVHEGGVLNQYSGVKDDSDSELIPEKAGRVKNARISDDTEEVEEIPYDPYDDIVTKEEIIDALEEARETDDDSKLKMLYAQELLNRKKEELKEKESKKRLTTSKTSSRSKK